MNCLHIELQLPGTILSIFNLSKGRPNNKGHISLMQVVGSSPTEIQQFAAMAFYKLFITFVHVLNIDEMLICHHKNRTDNFIVEHLIRKWEKPWVKQYNMRNSFSDRKMQRVVGLDYSSSTIGMPHKNNLFILRDFTCHIYNLVSALLNLHLSVSFYL